MLDACAKNGDMRSCLCFFRRMPDRDVISWTTLIHGFLLIGLHQEVIEVFEVMMSHQETVKANEATFVCVLSSCANLDGCGGFNKGKQLHGHIIKNDIQTAFIGTSLIDFYGKMGSPDYALKIFSLMKAKETCVWNALINSLANNGYEMQALEIFALMKKRGICPDRVTFVAVLTACARAKFFLLGFDLFRSMSFEFHVSPVAEHYACLVDLLGRAGLLREACEVVKNMPFEPDASVLGGLLNACKHNGAFKCSSEVGEKINRLWPQSCSQYVALATLSAELERWDHAAAIRKSMVRARVRKPPACSWIDHL